MRKVKYESEAHNKLALSLVAKFHTAFVEKKTHDDMFDARALHDPCWLNRFMEQVTREANWPAFQYIIEEDILNIVKYSYNLPSAFKQPVHGRGK